LDVVRSDSGAKSCNNSVLLTSGEGAKVGIIVKFDGFEVGFPIPPVAISLRCGSVGDCVAGGKLGSQVVILEMTMGGSKRTDLETLGNLFGDSRVKQSEKILVRQVVIA
jgi:hypothetical protein